VFHYISHHFIAIFVSGILSSSFSIPKVFFEGFQPLIEFPNISHSGMTISVTEINTSSGSIAGGHCYNIVNKE
jgi:hypothetical protein